MTRASDGMVERCETCRFVRPHNSKAFPELRKCHRRPPEIEGFPTVVPADWCGEYEPVST